MLDTLASPVARTSPTPTRRAQATSRVARAQVQDQGRKGLSPALRLTILAGLALISVVAFMTIGVRDWGFSLPFRGTKVVSMALVGYAIALSTVLFQTVTHNRILTPSIMGFDVLFQLVQTTLVFTLGGFAYSTIDPQLRFALDVAVMMTASLILFRWMFGSRRSLHLMVLLGIVFGVFFRSLTNLMQRLIAPNEFSVLQDAMFGTFNSIEGSLLAVSLLAIGAVSVVAWRIGHTFDVLALGREVAINLGVPYERTVLAILALISVLVSVSTALVGPITFFGLLVASIAHLIMGSGRHRHVIPAAALLAVICLIGGQTLLERAFGFNTALSIIIEFAGGIVFILLLLRGAAR